MKTQQPSSCQMPLNIDYEALQHQGKLKIYTEFFPPPNELTTIPKTTAAARTTTITAIHDANPPTPVEVVDKDPHGPVVEVSTVPV